MCIRDRYWVYLIANSTLSETDDFGKMETLTDLRAKVQQDELPNRNAGSRLAYPGSV